MKRKAAVLFPVIAMLFAVSGCAIKTHSVYEDRKDQDLSQGNLGYVTGAPAQKPQAQAPDKVKREIKVVEIELFPWLRKPSEREAERERQAKRQKAAAPVTQPAAPAEEEESEGALQQPEAAAAMREYTVQPNDTLQKISQKFYGTYKKWRRIYQANNDKIADPNRLRAGMVLKIPVDAPVQPAPVQPEKLK